MSKPKWSQLATMARLYAEAANAVHHVRTTGAEAASIMAEAMRLNGSHPQAERLDRQVREMTSDPIGHHYGRHKHGKLEGRPRLPEGWPNGVDEYGWDPANEVKVNLEMARDLISAANAAFDEEQAQAGVSVSPDLHTRIEGHL